MNKINFIETLMSKYKFYIFILVYIICQSNNQLKAQDDSCTNRREQILLEKECKEFEESPQSEEVIIGVNWHLGRFQACSDELFLAGYLFDNQYLFENENRLHNAQVYLFKDTSSIYNLNNLEICLRLFEIDYATYEAFYNTNKQLVEYMDYCHFLNIFDIGYDYWIEQIIPNIGRNDNYDYYSFYNNVILDTLPNYYKMPYSSDWNIENEDYLNTTSKMFYLVLFKCKIKYITLSNFKLDIPFPNLDLDISSDNLEKGSLCSFKKVPVHFITKIESIEPYIVKNK
jgi:hypothetical protein